MIMKQSVMKTWQMMTIRDQFSAEHGILSRGICLFPWNFHVFVELAQPSDKGTNTIYFGRRPQSINYYIYTWFHHEIHYCHKSL